MTTRTRNRPRAPHQVPRPSRTPGPVEDSTYYVVTRRPMQLNGRTLPIGAPIPDDEVWPRIESSVRAGLLAQRTGPKEAVVPDPAQVPETVPGAPLPEQTDNTERPEDGPQDVSQDPDVVYDDGVVHDG